MQYGRFLIRRVVHSLFVIWGAATVVFFLRFLTPGDPVTALTPPDAGTEVRQALRERLGLDEPIYVQYFDYITDLVVLDLGNSMDVLDRGVLDWIFWTRFLRSIELAISATIIAILIAIPLGVISARRRHSPADYSATLFSLAGISTPNFWLGLMLILLIAVPVGFIPTGTPGPLFHEAVGDSLAGDPSALGDWFRFMILPAITLGTYFTALITRLTRSGMLEEIGKAYVKACRAKGLPETLTMYRHVLRNTLIPIVTILGLQLGTLIGGAIITETVFEWNGLGQLLIERINARDWTMIQGIVIIIAVGFVTINTIVDLIYAYLDPRVMDG
jgi:peptide/nickel transport system permease protein